MVTKLLERAIEIEGLLRIIRDGNPMPETYTLLSNKAVELAEEAMLLEERAPLTEPDTEPLPTTEAEPEINGDPESEPEINDAPVTEPEHEIEGAQATEPTPDINDVKQIEPEPDIEPEPEVNPDVTIPNIQKEASLIVMDPTFSEMDKIEKAIPPTIVMIEDSEDASSKNEEIQDDLPETDEVIVDFSEVKTSAASKPAINTSALYSDNDEDEDDILLSFDEEEEKFTPEDTTPKDKKTVGEIDKDTSEGKEESVIEIKVEESKEVPAEKDIEIINDDKEKKSVKKPNKLKSAFSLNDRFLYSREIFDGKMKMFDSTLDFIEDIENFSVIEDFFYNEMELDPDNPSVISFMDILRPHFINDKL